MSSYWVKISRPDPDGLRKVRVNGDVVGEIYPASLGATGEERRGRVGRREVWHVATVSGPLGEAEILASEARLIDAIAWARECDTWPVQCWNYISGMGGYLPDNAGCCVGREAAVSGLIEQFELGDGQAARSLRKHGYTRLDNRNHRYGAEYCEVFPCECEDCGRLTIEEADVWECRKCQR